MTMQKYLIALLIVGALGTGIAINFRSIKNFLSNHKILQIQVKQQVALMRIEGSITSARPSMNQIEQAADSQYKGLIIHIDCGGGLAGSANMLFLELKRLQKSKPIVVVVENTCCSGAYWLACAADYIIAPASADIGNIGARQTLEREPTVKSESEKSYIILQAGKYKSAGDPHTPLTDEHIDYLQNLVEGTYDEFSKDVAESRNLSLDKRHEWADGQIFKSSDAVQNGLIDKVGCYSDAVDTMKDLLQQRNIDVSAGLDIVEIE
ncbi:MAG: S49 family peptidase [Candidatus Babeliaceae bacterium]